MKLAKKTYLCSYGTIDLRNIATCVRVYSL